MRFDFVLQVALVLASLAPTFANAVPKEGEIAAPTARALSAAEYSRYQARAKRAKGKKRPPYDTFKKYGLSRQLPGLPFRIPQSYAGYMSVKSGDAKYYRQLYFWYTPTDNRKGANDIIVWFNGGPGCSSMEGLLQENGPFVLPYYPIGGSVKPYLNKYSNHKAAHAIWIDSPGTTGFSKAGEHVKGLRGVATDIAGFFVNFFEQFPHLKGKRLWLTGESFAGAMIPYMADHIYNNPSLKGKGINLKGIQINDPSFANNNLMQQFPILTYASRYQRLLNITDAQLADLKSRGSKFGLTTYVKDNLRYPPKGPLTIPAGWSPEVFDAFNEVLNVYGEAHCSSVYDISVQCPNTLDPLGYPQAAWAPTADNFLNNVPGFKKAINADPSITFMACKANTWDYMNDPHPADSILPSVLEKSERVLIGGGNLDILLLTIGSQLAIQNMTWAGKQGFQREPHKKLRTHQGERGTYHTERKLTFIEYEHAGHMVPQDDPPAGLKSVQYLIGQIRSMQ